MQIVIWHIFFGYPKSSLLLAKGSARVLRCTTTTICPFSWATSFFFFPDEINARWSIWIYLRLPRFFISEFSPSNFQRNKGVYAWWNCLVKHFKILCHIFGVWNPNYKCYFYFLIQINYNYVPFYNFKISYWIKNHY